MKLPLEGVNVVELGTHVVVPNATRFLADWGANVIKIEAPLGEEWRKVGPSYKTPMTDEENPLFQEQNSNKRLIGINLKSEDGVAVFCKLIARAYIFVSNVRMNSLLKMGLGYDDVKAFNASIIYAHFTGYGHKGADAARPGFDMSTFWARSGSMRDWVDSDSFPFKPPGGFGDAATSAAFTTGILAALYAKKATGEGTFVTSSLLGCGIWYNQTGIISAQYGNDYPVSRMSARNPFTHIYKCKGDEYIIITVPNYDGRYEHVCKAMGLDEYVHDERYAKRNEQGLFFEKNLEDFVSIMNARFMEKTQHEWCDILNDADIACEKLVHMREVPDDKQAWDNGYFENIHFPTSGKDVAFPAVPVSFSAFRSKPARLPGTVGCDTSAIMNDLAYSADEIACMRKNGAIK